MSISLASNLIPLLLFLKKVFFLKLFALSFPSPNFF